MTMQSLQKIITLEDELYATEQAEAEKASQWVKLQQQEIHSAHEQKLLDLEQQVREVRTQASVNARKRADEMIRLAKERANYLHKIDDPILLKILSDFDTESNERKP